ncbi:MAG: fibronectin type III domain-containing protein [Planctomycetes bacterium]|nr:fibronectin type III domain-containing protein [Planctomycetota bacterium]
MRKWSCLGLVLACGSLAFGGSVQEASQALREAFPEVQFFTQDGLTQVYGTTFSYGSSVEESADAFVRTYGDVFGVQPDDLQPGDATDTFYTLPLLYDEQSGTYQATMVCYRQYHAGLPVYGADLRLLVANRPGHPLVLANSALRDLSGFVAATDAAAQTGKGAPLAAPLVDEGAAQAAAAAFAPGLSEFTAADLVIYPDTTQKPYTLHVATTFIGSGVAADDAPLRRRFVCDAATGTILHTEDLIIFTDVSGNVSGNATTIPKAEQCNPEVATPMAYARVNIVGGGSAYADANGNFTIANGGTTDVTVQSPMTGLYFTVTTNTGATETLSQTVTPGTPVNFLHNAANTSEDVRAQFNGYVQANLIRDWVLAQHPTYPTIATQTSGSSINFCAANIASNYGDTAYSSVIHHEYGHHMVATGGSGQGQYGEGMGDVVAVLLADDPILGYGFYYNNCSSGIRTAANSFQYPCSGEIHYCGQLISGCVWSTRNELVGAGFSDYLAVLSKLTVNSIPLHSGDLITPAITNTYLALDNTYYGGLHSAQITAGFGAHNMIPSPPPANDACANAIAACPGTTYTGNTGAASNDGSASCGSSSTAPDVWYSYSPATSGTATFSMCASSPYYDSVLSVHTGCPGTSLNQIGCDDDGCFGAGPSVVTAAVTGGNTYFIRIAGYAGAAGPFALNITGPACGTSGNYTLATSVSGQGSIALNPSGGSYPPGTTVTLTANPAAGWHFDQWAGDLAGSANPATLLMDGNKSATAIFVQDQYTLTVNVTGSGSVALNPPGPTYPSGTTVTLTATAAAGWVFDHWEGGLTGSANPATLVMNSHKTVTAFFVQPPPTPPNAPSNLNVTNLGGGQARLNWQDNSNNEDGFRIERQKRSGGRWNASGTFTVGANVTTATDTPGAGQYRYRVQAYNASGNSAWTGYVTVKVR